MAINPSQTDTITIPELDTDILQPTSLIPFSNPLGKMKKTTVADMVAAISTPVPVPTSSVDFII